MTGRAMVRADEEWMQQALALADKAEREHDEVPVAALVVGPDGALLAEGFNRNIGECDPSAHAEIVAILKKAITDKEEQRRGEGKDEGCAQCGEPGQKGRKGMFQEPARCREAPQLGRQRPNRSEYSSND